MNTVKTILLATTTLFISVTASAQTFKEPVAFKLKNEMNIIVSEHAASPKAYASFTLDTEQFSGKKNGIVELFNAVLNESAAKNSNTSFKDNSGKLATANTSFDAELTEMAALIQNAALNQANFNTAKAKLLLSLKAQDYDYDQTVTEESINELTLADVKDFYAQISPEKTFLTIAGNVDLKSAKASAKKAFENWGAVNID